MLYLFFFKQKTAYEMRISDWSSDVCSSDLEHSAGKLADEARGSAREHVGAQAVDGVARLQSTGNRGHVGELAFIDSHSEPPRGSQGGHSPADRKSTRLNSSH